MPRGRKGREGDFLCSRCEELKPLNHSRRGLCFDCHNSAWRKKKGFPAVEEGFENDRRGARAEKTEQPQFCCSRCKEFKSESEFSFKKYPEVKSKQCRRCTLDTGKLWIREQDSKALRLSVSGCEICGSNEKTLHVDHDHSTGEIRGVLCFLCNSAIGKLKDSAALLRKAAEYIEKGA